MSAFRILLSRLHEHIRPLSLVISASMLANAAWGAESISPDRFAVHVSGHTLQIPIESSLPLAVRDTRVERIAVVIHGSSQNAGEYRRRVQAAAAMRSGEAQRTLVVAPQFLEEADILRWGLAQTMLFWSEGWRTGSKSLSTTSHPRPARISSYAVIDQLIDSLTDPALFPNLKQVVIAGHSAGGQFVQRYAAGTLSVDRHPGTAFRFVVANAGSYLYLSADRMVPGVPLRFAKPSAAQQSACPYWNDYKYGLLKLNEYMAAAATGIVARYGKRELRYLLGGEDTGTDDLDTSCAAYMTGAHRLERGTVYFVYLHHLYGASIESRHQLAVVPGVAHSSEDMFQSEEGIDALFGELDSPVTGPPGAPYILP